MMYCPKQLLSHFDGTLLKIVENIKYGFLDNMHDSKKDNPSWYNNKCVSYWYMLWRGLDRLQLPVNCANFYKCVDG